MTFGIELQGDIDFELELSAYEPFVCEEPGNLLFMLPVIVDEGSRAKYDNDWDLVINTEFEGIITEIYRDKEDFYHYISYFLSRDEMWSCIDYNQDLSQMKLRVFGHANFLLYSLNNALMIMFALCCSAYDSLLFHASVIMHDERGYLFLGKSGTGKSTHSRLWLEHIEGCELLNDDNPVVRIIDGKPWVFGTPWSGKTPCYKNKRVPVGGFVKLFQASVNEITRLNTFQAYAAILPTVSNMRWENNCANAVSSTIEKIIQQVPVFSLRNRPEKEAALMSFNSVKYSKDGK